MKNILNPLKLSLVALCAGALAGQAASVTWTGNSSANWSNAGNWNPGLPNPGDALIFAASGQTAPNNDLTGVILSGITFTPTSATYVLGGNNSITLDTALVANSNTVLQTIAMPVVLTNAVTFNTVSNAVSTLTGDLEVDGAITGDTTGALVKTGGGTLTVVNAAHAGGTTVAAGLLVASNNIGNVTLSGGAFKLNYRTYFINPTYTLAANAGVGIDLLDNAEPRGVDQYGNITGAGYKLTKIGQGIWRQAGGNITVGSIDVAEGTLANLGGSAMAPTKWGTTNVITVENGATLRADDGGICPNPIVLMGGDGTSSGNYTHQGALVSGSRNNAANPTNNIFTNTITLMGDSTIGSQYGNLILSGNITGPGGLTKIGANPLVLSGTNSYGTDFTGTTLSVGTLQLGSSAALPTGPASGTLNMSPNTTLDLNGNAATIYLLNDNSAGTATLDNSAATPATLTLQSSSYYAGVVRNSGGGPLSLVVAGGSAYLVGANSHTGSNVVQAGSLELNIPTGTTTGGLVSLADGTTLTLHKTTPGSSLKASGATFGTSGATTLNIDLNNYGNPSAPIINATNGTGVLAANGTVTINFNNTGNLSLGQFAIVKYTTRTGTGNFVFTPISGITAQIVTNTANKSIDLQITSAPITTWRGNNNNLWDTTTANWRLSGSPVVYADGISVFFDDTALTNNVNLTATLSPGSVLLNTTNTYTFGGAGTLSGGPLTKNGSGTLILNVSGNSYSATTIGAGTLQVGNNDVKGDLGGGNVDDEGTLVFNLTNNYSVPGIISGLGNVVQNNSNSIITLSQANTYSGGTAVNQGVLKMGNNLALGAPAGPVQATVASGASLDLGGKQATNAYIVINGNGSGANIGALQTTTGGYVGIGSQVGVKYLRLAGNAAIGDNTGDFVLGTDGNVNGQVGTCSIDGQGYALTKIGNNGLYLEATNLTALSQFNIASGWVLWCNTAKTPIGTSCPIVISNGTYIDSWDNFANNGITIANNITIGAGGGQLWNTRGMYFNHACYNTYSGSLTLNADLSLRNISTYGGGPNNVATSGSLTFSGPISGPGGISCTNGNPYTAGGSTSQNTVTLSGAATYTGQTFVTNGVLQLSAIQQGGGAYVVADNTTLDVPSQTGYSTVPMSTLALGSVNGATLSLGRVTSLSTSNAPITATNLTVLGTSSLLLAPQAYTTPGQYPLIKYGTMSGGGTFVAGAAGTRGTPGYISNNVANSSIDLVVPGGNPVLWTGSVNNSWDIAATANFSYLGAGTLYQQPGSLGDSVTFDDTSTVTNVNITVPVSPAVTIVNTTNTYSFLGTNITGASSLVKNGSGTLVLTNRNNNFTGGTLINAGTLRMASVLTSPLVALNNLTGTVTVNSGATLDMGSNNLTTLVINASGAGVGGNGAIQANYSGNAQGWGINKVNQTGNLTIGGNNRWDVRNGSGVAWNVSSNGATLTKVGSGYTALVACTVSTNLGDITILGGTLSFQTSTTGQGNTNNTIYIGNGGSLGMYQLATPIYKNIVCSNGAAISADGGNNANQNVIVGPINLVSGSINLNFNFYNAGIFSNTISGAGGLNLQVQSIIKFAGSNTYSGNTTIPRCNGQTDGFGTRIMLLGNGSMTKSALITMQGVQSGQAYAGFIDVLGRPDQTLTLGTNQILRGDNGSFVRGSVVATAGSGIAPGGINQSNIQYMSISNSLTFQAGSTNYMDVYKTGTLLTNDLIIVSNLLTYAGTLQIQTNGLTALAVNDAFKLFSAGSVSGNFANIVDTSGTTWSFNPLTGIATVTGLPPTVNTNPATANFQFTSTGSALNFTWASDHLGWQLYTNAVGLNAAGSWFPVAGSAGGTGATVNINPASTNVFFQLRYP